MKKRKLVSCVIAVALISLASFIWYDIAPARASLNGLKNSLGEMEGYREKNDADLDAAEACLAIAGPSIQFVPAERSCFVTFMPKVKSYMGARVFGHFAYVWLRKYPHDEGVRNAALKAIDNGRDDLLSQQEWMYQTLQKNANLHNNSLILSFIHGEVQPPDVFQEEVRVLDDLEFTVLMPSVKRKQELWLDDAYKLR